MARSFAPDYATAHPGRRAVTCGFVRDAWGCAGPGAGGGRGARVVVVAEAGGEHRLDVDVGVLRHVRRLDVVGQHHLARGQRVAVATVAVAEVADEAGVGGAAAGAGPGRVA